MKRGIAMVVLLGMTLAACDKPAAPRGNAVAEAGPDPIEAKIVALPERLRRATFYRAILDARVPLPAHHQRRIPPAGGREARMGGRMRQRPGISADAAARRYFPDQRRAGVRAAVIPWRKIRATLLLPSS